MAKSFSSLVNQVAREQARRKKEEQRLSLAKHRQQDKEQKLEYLDSRINETEILNFDTRDKLEVLDNILAISLLKPHSVSFNSLRINEIFPEFTLPTDLNIDLKAPNRDDFIKEVKTPSAFEKILPGWEDRYQKAIAKAESKYEASKNEYDQHLEKIEALRLEYENKKRIHENNVKTRNEEINKFEYQYENGEPSAVCSYNAMVLEQSIYPDDFPQEFQIAYLPEPQELVIEYELPSVDVIPHVSEYKYIKTKDVIEEKARKTIEIKRIYQEIISSICLRTIHEIFDADQANVISVVSFNGFVQTVNPATGKDIRPYLITIRTTKERFGEINLARIDKKACLRNLGAQVSPNPDELQAVKPIVDFNMVDKRFVEESDIMDDLESKPNLMDLNPFEFENLISNLFGQMGFESKLTRSSKDGGVDAIAFDPRPILGGKVVIQAKRYKNVVGVSAVRDLYGTMINEGANKGILVTTSHYGPDAYDFSKDKPMELIDGSGLLYLLNEQGVRAKIIFPDE